jgi:hypothetical protein
MNIKIAAMNMVKHIDNSDLPDMNQSFGKNHMYDMVDKIITDEVSGEKAHRWLGYIQGCVCVSGGATLDQLKQVNEIS